MTVTDDDSLDNSKRIRVVNERRIPSSDTRIYGHQKTEVIMKRGFETENNGGRLFPVKHSLVKEDSPVPLFTHFCNADNYLFAHVQVSSREQHLHTMPQVVGWLVVELVGR